MRTFLAISVCLLSGLGGRAEASRLWQEANAKPQTVAQAAAAVRAAVHANDAAVLVALAGRDEPDPWLVADLLCEEGAREAARAFAKAGPQSRRKPLLGYVSSRSERSTAQSDVLESATTLLAQGDPKGALATLESIDIRAGEVVSVQLLMARGDALRKLRRLQESAAAYASAADVAGQLGWVASSARALKQVGVSAYLRSDWRSAAKTWRRQLEVERSQGNRDGVARALGNIGLVHSRLGEFDSALRYCAQSLRIAMEVENRAVVSLMLGNLGNIHSQRGEHVAAEKHYDWSLRIAEHAGDRRRVANVLGNLGLIRLAAGDHGQARQHFERSLALAEGVGDRPQVAQARLRLANIHYRHGEYADALQHSERALRIQADLGDRAGAALTLSNVGSIHESLGDYVKALTVLQRAMRTQQDLGDRVGLVITLANLGNVYANMGQYPQALEAERQSLELAESMGNKTRVAVALGHLGNIHFKLGDSARAIEHHERAHAIAKDQRDLAGVAATLGNLGNTFFQLGHYAKALVHYERARRMAEEIGDPASLSASLINIGRAHLGHGRYAEALASCEHGLRQARAIRRRETVANALATIGSVHMALSDYGQALEFHEQALSLREVLGDRRGITRSHGSLGDIHARLGDYRQAYVHYERSRHIADALGDRGGVAVALARLGTIHFRRGDYARALAFQDRALRLAAQLQHRAVEAATLGNIGTIHYSIGDHAKARENFERALELLEQIGDRLEAVSALGNLGSLYHKMGDNQKALDVLERALEIEEKLGDRRGVALTLGNLGVVHHSMRNHDRALVVLERALEMKKQLRDRVGIASTLGNLGNVQHSLGNRAKAMELHEEALGLARDLGSLELEMRQLRLLAAERLEQGQLARAAETARAGVERLARLAGRLGDEQGAMARDEWGGLIETGIRAAMQRDDVAEACYFIESGRAVALLESLGGRDGLEGEAIPGELLEEERAARAEVVRVQSRLARTLEADEQRAVRRELNGAQDALIDAVTRIQRSAKSAADVEYPQAAELAQIQSVLDPHQALVSYATLSDATVALIVTREAAKTVTLKRFQSPIDLDDPTQSWEATVAELRRTVVEPLGISKRIEQVLVSPAGSLSYLAFSTLLPDREVTYVPSGSTYRVLRGDRELRGEGILGLGDPAYPGTAGSTSHRVYRQRSGRRLDRLPLTRDEVKAIADTRLLGREASRRHLGKSLGLRQRWRAVHFACHGLVDPERPLLSSLALTPEPEHGGFLTCLDIFRMRIPADLVVLSACETAKGKIYRTEGILGLTRAFMFAGTPRVLCSLWKVDDEATRALMVKFYELWNPRDGTKGLRAAAALKEAQAFVRNHPDHPEWKHPYYWAAWVLWGLGS